jgi:hypothetical protein
MTGRFFYPKNALRGDYLRAVTGIVLCLVPVIVGIDNAITSSVLSAIAAIFALFGVRTFLRNVCPLEVSDEGIRVVGPGGRGFTWSELSGLSLVYFSTWRSRDNGWMELRLEGGGNRLRMESSLEGFEKVACRAATEASSRGISMTETTRRNLNALGAPAVLPAGAALRGNEG